MDAITIGNYLVCINAPQVKIWEENSWFMTWEWQQLPSLESLHLRVLRAFVPLVLCNVCNRPTNVTRKTSWWQTVPHATLNWPLNTGCFMKLAIIVRASSASPRKKKWGNLLVHTGGIDGMWKISKGAVSSSWNTRKDGVVNPQLLEGIRIWQWRWHHGNSTDLLSLTGKALSKCLDTWQARKEKGKGFHPVTTTKPCKYHGIPSKSFNFSRENLR